MECIAKALYYTREESEVSMNKYYPNLFKPLLVRNMMLKNRIISSIMGIPSSHVLLSSVNYGNVSLMDKSAGGAAMDFVSIECMADETAQFPKADRDVIRESISVARQYGAKVGTWCVPRYAPSAAQGIRDHYDGNEVYGPSAYATKKGGTAIPLTKENIVQIMHQVYLDATAIRNFGFDFIYLYLGYEELPIQFLSPAFNHRTDEYGGSLENRMRFAVEYVSTVRKAVGKDYPIVVLFGASDYLKGSYTFEDAMAMLEAVKDDIDLINVSCGMDMIPGTFPGMIDTSKGDEAWYSVNGKHCQTIFEPEMTNVGWAKKVKEAMPDKLVSVVGSIMTPEDGEKLIADGIVDAVTMGRPLNADPYLPRKAMEGRRKDIVPCIRCMSCYHTATQHTNVQCSVNPRYRRENRVPLKLEKAERKKRVVIIGAGPAGCKAALTAAERGHEVILLEKSGQTGGMINYGGKESHKKELKAYRDYLDYQVHKATIDLRLNTTGTPELLEELHPDVVLIAIGSDPIMPNFKGRDLPNVHLFIDTYDHMDELGNHVCVVGGGMVGVEFMVELLEQGHTVTIVDPGKEIAAKGNVLYKAGLHRLLSRFEDKLTIRTQCACEEFRENGAVIKNEEGNEELIQCDSIVVAVGLRSKRSEAFSLYGIADETMMMGDCEKVGQVINATNDAYFIAANI